MTDIERVIAYLQAQIEEAESRPIYQEGASPYLKGFRNGLALAVRTLKDNEVNIFSTGADEFYSDDR